MIDRRYSSLEELRPASTLAIMRDHLIKMSRKAFERFSARSQQKRAAILTSRIDLCPSAKIIDLGGNDGGQVARLFPEGNNVTICDLSEAALAKARARADLTLSRRMPRVAFPFRTIISISVSVHRSLST